MDDIEKTVALGPEGSGSDTGFGKCPVCGGAFEPDPEHPDRLRCSACRFSQQQPEQIAPGRVVGGKFRARIRRTSFPTVHSGAQYEREGF